MRLRNMFVNGNARLAVYRVESLMTINKDLDLFDLMCWFMCGCLAIFWIVILGHVLLMAGSHFQRLLELPCG